MAAIGRLAAGSLSEPVAIRSVHSGNRMTRLSDQELYRELWWRSLGESFRDMRVSNAAMQAWRRAYATFRARRRPRWKALTALAHWLAHDPSQVAVAYGHFDLTLRAIYGENELIVRFLSVKNRLLTRS